MREICILALVKGEEQYVFIYDEDCREPVIQVMRDWAADPRLSFSWFDAAVLVQRLRQPEPPANGAPHSRLNAQHRFGRAPEA